MHRLLDEYLGEVSARLDKMPVSRREEELREMRAHLQDAVAAGVERGASEEDAVRGVLNQFGSLDAVAGEAMSAWRRERAKSQRNFWTVVVGYLTSGYLLDLLPLLLGALANGHIAAVVPSSAHAARMAVWGIANSLFIVAVLSAIFPRQAVSGLAAAMAIKLMLFATFFVIVSRTMAHQRQERSLSSYMLMGVTMVCGYALQLLVAWLASRVRLSLAGRRRRAHG
ncbi:MAG: permease prefix domain 1-containing protein [Capsulimonas sp.]|uniref:permease prefix domain 1-containing protein n=1 Tax=Capsulimonas sp. TaxID=2494211 RepID=UPI00326386D3